MDGWLAGRLTDGTGGWKRGMLVGRLKLRKESWRQGIKERETKEGRIHE